MNFVKNLNPYEKKAMKKSILSVATLISLSVSFPASAAILMEYQFSNASPVVHDSNLSAGDSAWVGLSGNAYGFGASLGSAYARANSGIGRSFNEGRYLTFTAEADEGFTVSLDSFQFLLGGTTNSSETIESVYAEVRTSVDNFASSLTLTPGSVTVASNAVPIDTSTPDYVQFTANLGGAFDNLEGITFRVYVYVQSTNSTSYARLDSFVLDGSVQAIPEPGTPLLIMSAVWIFFTLRGRHLVRA